MPPPSRPKARKPANDPVVEQLLQMKDNWKYDVSTLVYDLIAFKRGLTGRGDAEHNLPPTKVTEPFDGSVSELLSEMAGEYQNVAQEALEIIQKQDEVSKTHQDRRQRKEKQHKERAQMPTKPKTTEPPKEEKNPLAPKFQAAASIETNAGVLSRTWYRATTPFSNETGRKTRVAILLRLVDLKHEIEEMQDAAVSMGNEDKERLNTAFAEYETKLRDIQNLLFGQYATEIGKTVDELDPSLLSGDQSKIQSKLKFFINEFSFAESVGIKQFKSAFGALHRVFNHATNDKERIALLHKMSLLYEDLKNYLHTNFTTSAPWQTVSQFSELSPVFIESDKKKVPVPKPVGQPVSPVSPVSPASPASPSPTSPETYTDPLTGRVPTKWKPNLGDRARKILQDVPDDDEEDENPASDSELISEAHNLFSRVLKRKKMNLPFGDWTVSSRIKLFDQLIQTRNKTKTFMRAIESGEGFDSLKSNFDLLKEDFDIIRNYVYLLSSQRGKTPKKKKQ